MKVIIVGCGEMGSGLALNLVKKHHQVTVIDSNPSAFKMLGHDFVGDTIDGIGFDKDVLEHADIRSADAVVACTNSDETNALIGRLSRNIYQVPHVISRLYVPRKAELYRTLGIQTISATTWGIHRVMELLSYDQLDSVLTIGENNVELFRIETPALLIGKTVNEMTIVSETSVVAITRDYQTLLPTMGTVLQQHDIIYIAAQATAVPRLKTLLGLR